MAFTAPTTRATDFLVTAAVWNAEHVDNWNTAVMRLGGRKSADTSRSVATFAADTDFDVAVASNGVYLVRYVFIAFGAVAFDWQLTFPTGGTVGETVMGNSSTLVTLSVSSTSPFDTGLNYTVPATIGAPTLSEVLYTNGSTAGTLGVEWRPVSASNVTMKANSTVWVCKLA